MFVDHQTGPNTSSGSQNYLKLKSLKSEPMSYVFPFFAEIPVISAHLYVHNHWKTPPACAKGGAFQGVGSTQVLEVLPDLRLDLNQAQWARIFGEIRSDVRCKCMVLGQIKVLCFRLNRAWYLVKLKFYVFFVAVTKNFLK